MQCPLCHDFSAPTLQLLLQHIGRVHSNSANFRLTCGVNQCQCVYTNFRRYKEHLKKKHGLPHQTCQQLQQTEENMNGFSEQTTSGAGAGNFEEGTSCTNNYVHHCMQSACTNNYVQSASCTNMCITAWPSACIKCCATMCTQLQWTLKTVTIMTTQNTRHVGC